MVRPVVRIDEEQSEPVRGICSVCGKWDHEHLTRQPCQTGVFKLPLPASRSEQNQISHEEKESMNEEDKLEKEYLEEQEKHRQLDPTSALIAERGKQYGPNPFNQETVALTWQALLEAHYQKKLPGPIPPHIVALMMLTMKACRAATPFPYHQDNYDDMHGYAKIGEICAKSKIPESITCSKCDRLTDESELCNGLCPRCYNLSRKNEGVRKHDST